MRSAGAVCLLLAACASAPQQHTWDSPEAAVRGLLDGLQDRRSCEELLGAEGCELISHDADDADDFATMRQLAQQELQFADADGGRKIALLGSEHWPLPLPLVRDGDRWRFDIAAARDEIRSRRIGGDELQAIASLQDFVDEHQQSAPQAPAACRWGPMPGYRFRVLEAQGEHAPGGARSYLDEAGKLGHGFAVIAWPEDYGSSGVMTFQVNQIGIVFEKDLGAGTAAAAEQIARYDPDPSWDPVGQ